VEQGVDGLDPARLIVAYEPIWAIGTGKTCEAAEANRICGLVRQWVGYPEVVIQYGGSVNPGTAAVCAQAITAGADVLRVHDVGPIAQTARMVDAIVRGSAQPAL